MELKINYQYSYFIHPFILKEGKYSKYIMKMLKDKRCELKRFQKEKDFKLYKYFLPKIREMLFSSFRFDNETMKKFEDMPIETQAAVLSKYDCNIFEYILEKDIQGKVDDNRGLYFNIQKIEIICFKTGICFLCFKTDIADYKQFSNILNFNYKFKDINSDVADFNGYDNIRLQTGDFSDVDTFRRFIQSITGSNIEAIKLNLDTETFLTCSYVCIDQQAWNNENGFSNIQHDFIKYSGLSPADDSRVYDTNDIEVFSKWHYAKIGLTKMGMFLFASSQDMNNYTILPSEFENEYLYTYIINLYKKIYLKKLEAEFKNEKKVRKARKKFVKFTRKLWIQEITENEEGTLLNRKLQNVLELDRLYSETKNKYNILYKDLNIESDRKITIGMAVILVISLIFNIMNWWGIFRRIKGCISNLLKNRK